MTMVCGDDGLLVRGDPLNRRSTVNFSRIHARGPECRAEVQNYIPGPITGTVDGW